MKLQPGGAVQARRGPRFRPRTWARQPVAVIVATVGMASFLVLRRLGTKPLWRDEAVSLSVARRPLARLLLVLTHHDANAGLYDLLLHGWLHIGTTTAWVRAPSAVCFVVAAGTAAWAGVRWRGPWFGLCCGLLVATNPFLLYYGQEARPYAMAVLFAVGSTAALFGRAEEPAPRAYAVLTVLLIYADLFAAVFVAAEAVALVVLYRRRRSPLPEVLVRCWWLIALATAPLALIMVARERSQLDWLVRPSATELERTLTGMMGGWFGFGVAAVVAVAALTARGLRDASPDTREWLAPPVLAAGFAIPPLLLWTVSQVVPVFVDRYVVCSAVALVGLVALGLDVIRKWLAPIAGLVVLAMLAGLGGARIVNLEAQHFNHDNAPAAVEFITDGTQRGDAIGFGGGGLRTVVDRYRPRAPGLIAPFDVALAPGGETQQQHNLYAREVGPRQLELRLRVVDRLWLVTDVGDHRYPGSGPFVPLRSSFTAAFVPAVTGTFGAIDVTLYIRKGSGLLRLEQRRVPAA